MNPNLKVVLIFTGVGAGVGALYGLMFVMYREQQKRAAEETEPVIPPSIRTNGQLISPEIADPERRAGRARTHSAKDRTPPAARQALMKRAKEIREAEGLGPAEAMKRAADEDQEAQA